MSKPRLTPEAIADIKRRLHAGRTPLQIFEAVKGAGEPSSGVSLASMYRIAGIVEVEQQAERKAAALTIARELAKGSSMSKSAISDLLYEATGIRLAPRDVK